MAMERIKYEEKEDYLDSQQESVHKIVAEDMNQIKRVFNNAADKIEEDLESTGKLRDDVEKKIQDYDTELNTAIENFDKKIDTSLSYLGVCEWQGSKVRFKLANGSWGEWHEVIGDNIITSAKLTETLDLSDKTITLPKIITIEGKSIDLTKLLFKKGEITYEKK